MNKILLNEPFTKWLLLERRHSAYHGLLKPIRICRFGETSELSMEEIHRHVHQFVHGTRNFWRQGQCSIKRGVDDQKHLTKKNLNIYVRFCNNFHLSVFSFACVINFWNRKETLWTPCIHIELWNLGHLEIRFCNGSCKIYTQRQVIL